MPVAPRAEAVCDIPMASPSTCLLAAGGGRPGSVYVGVSAAVCIPASEHLDTGWFADVNCTLNVAESASVELSLGLYGYDVEVLGGSGSLRSVALTAVAQAGKPLGSVRLYVGGGGGYLMNDLTGFGSVEADGSFAALVCAGVDFPVNANGSMAVELRYLVSRAGMSAGDDLELDAFATRVNYVFLF
jgi:hypothetical protein